MEKVVPLVSIIVNNYNYAIFLEHALESVVRQKYLNLEIIVVDDGSTDHSATVINKYRNHFICIHKENGGQASAMNVGFAASSGEWILFLDADDALFPDAITTFIERLPQNIPVAKLHAPLVIADTDGELSDRITPYQPLASGDLKPTLLEWGPESYVCPPTSGNLWNRSFLSEVLPIPEKPYRVSADAYLFTLAPLFGNIVRLEQPIGLYRLHGHNAYWQKQVPLKQLRTEICRYQKRTQALRHFSQNLGIPSQARIWKLRNRYYLAKVLIFCKLQNRSLSPKFLLASLRASLIAPIFPTKRLAWSAWFLGLWFAPYSLVPFISQSFGRLRTRI